MAETLTNIQILARDYARSNDLAIASGTGLDRTNMIYRKLVALHPWPEFYQTDETISTRIGKETENWPDTIRFVREPTVEIQSPEDGKFHIIPDTVDNLRWAMAQRKPNGTPDYYRRSIVKNVLKISFRPIPDFVATVKLSGQVEPNDFTAIGNATVFQNPAVDDAFALWLAAIDSDKNGFIGRAVELIGMAVSHLSTATGRSISPAELGFFVGAA